MDATPLHALQHHSKRRPAGFVPPYQFGTHELPVVEDWGGVGYTIWQRGRIARSSAAIFDNLVVSSTIYMLWWDTTKERLCTHCINVGPVVRCWCHMIDAGVEEERPARASCIGKKTCFLTAMGPLWCVSSLCVVFTCL